MQPAGVGPNSCIVAKAGEEAILLASSESSANRERILIRRYARSSAGIIDLLHNEYDITRGLTAHGILIPAQMCESEPSPYLVYLGEGVSRLRSLSSYGRLPCVTVVHVADRLLHTVGDLHTHGLLHLAINPFNLLYRGPLNGQRGPVIQLTGFGRAQRMDGEEARSDFRHYPAEYWPYLAPEQTGRTRNFPSVSSDYYAIGATLYRLLAGIPPFSQEGTEEVIHAILARAPAPVQELATETPGELAGVIMRLLAKDPEERFQSAGEILRLLRGERSSRRASRAGSRTPKPKEQKSRAVIETSADVVGRASEQARLKLMLDCVRAGESGLLCVTGFAGSGKTMLVRECFLPAARPGVQFLSGKCEKGSTVPYSAFVQACEPYVSDLLSGTTNEGASWRESAKKLLVDSASELVLLFPRLASLVGGPPKNPVAGAHTQSTESKRRLRRGVIQLLRSWTETGRVVVLFVDDLQWADIATLELCLAIIEASIPRLLLVVAFRNHEPSQVQNLDPLVSEIETKAGSQGSLSLGPFSGKETRALVEKVAPRLRRSQAATLTDELLARTGGNPFFLRRQINTYQRRRVLFYDYLHERWQYQPLEQKDEERAEDVIEFLRGLMQQLPSEQQVLLGVASLSSEGVSAAMMAGITDMSGDRALHAVRRLAADGYLRASESADGQTRYRFSHDNIREAASKLVEADHRASIHLHFARLLRSAYEKTGDDRGLYELLEHLNAARDEIVEKSERYDAAILNLESARSAKSRGALSAAFDYSVAGKAFLPPDCWTERYELALSLHNELADSALHVGEYERMDEAVEAVVRNRRTYLDSVPAYEVRVQALMARNRTREATRLCFEVARALGFRHVGSRNKAVLAIRYLIARFLFRGFSADQAHKRPLSDPTALAAQRMLFRGYAPTIISASQTLRSLCIETMLITLREGISAYAPAALALWALLRVSEGGIDEGFRIGEMALDLQERLGSPASRAGTLTVVNFFIRPWKLHYTEAAPPLLGAMEEEIKTGEYENAAMSGHFYAALTFLSGDRSLSEAIAEIAGIEAVIEGLHQERTAIAIRRHRQGALSLMNTRTDVPPCVFAGPAIDESKLIPDLERAGDTSGLCMLFTYKAMIAYLFDEHEHAFEFERRAASLLRCVPCQPPVHMMAFYGSLIILRSLTAVTGVHRNLPPRRARLREVRHNLRLLERWARSSPVNFRHRYDLVLAEYRAVIGNRRANETFRAARENAAFSRYLQDEALAERRWAIFCEASGRVKEAKEHFDRAIRLYEQWGATAVVRHLRLQAEQALQAPQGLPQGVVDKRAVAANERSPMVAIDIDLETLVNAGTIISSEMDVDSLLEKVTTVIMRCAGATGARLEIEEEGALVAAVQALAAPEGISVEHLEGPELRRLDSAIAVQVRSAKEPFVSPEGSTESLRRGRSGERATPRSALCAPLQHRGAYVGLIYLENSLAQGVFTPERLRVVELLAAQAAAAFENASLYRLRQTLAEQRERLMRADRLASLGVLVAGVAHDVSSPNHVIRLDADYVREELGRVFAELKEREEDAQAGVPQAAAGSALCANNLYSSIERALRRISDASARIAANVEEMKEFVRGSGGRPFRVIDINDVVRSTVSLSEALLSASTDAFALELAHRLPAVNGDFGKLQQLVLNLLENACAALTCKTQRIVLRTFFAARTGRVVLFVKDEGRGITSENLPRVTEPFFSTRRTEGGTGLGLAICTEIVNEHGAEMRIRSRPCNGTTVRISFPAATAC